MRLSNYSALAGFVGCVGHAPRLLGERGWFSARDPRALQNKFLVCPLTLVTSWLTL
jgi:hypothetical protein